MIRIELAPLLKITFSAVVSKNVGS